MSEAPGRGGSPWRVSLGASQLPLAVAKHTQTQPSPGAFTSEPRHSLGQRSLLDLEPVPVVRREPVDSGSVMQIAGVPW